MASYDDVCACALDPNNDGATPTNNDFKEFVQQALCRIVVGVGGGGNVVAPEFMQDLGNNNTIFLRVYDIAYPQATPAVFTDYNLDGTVYAPTGPVIPANEVLESASPLLGSLAGAAATTVFGVLVANVGNPTRIFSVGNGLDRDVILSFDGVTDQYFLGQGDSMVVDFGATGLSVAGDLEVKTLISAATTGTIYATIVRAA